MHTSYQQKKKIFQWPMACAKWHRFSNNHNWFVSAGLATNTTRKKATKTKINLMAPKQATTNWENNANWTKRL